MRQRPLVPPTLVALALAAAAWLVAGVARADDKAACVASYERAQVLRRQNELREAREELLVCARASCPKLVQKDCAAWMTEVSASLPSLVFEAHDAQGHDRADVRISIDGAPVKEQLGQEVIVDPGKHALRVERDSGEPLQQEIVVRVGEKARVVPIQFPEAPPPPPGKPPPPTEPGRETRPLPIVSPVLGAVGLGMVSVGSYLAFSGSSQLSELRTTCAPHCEQSDVDRVNLRYRIAAGAIGVGVIAVGVAVWLFVTRPTQLERRTALLSLARGEIP